MLSVKPQQTDDSTFATLAQGGLGVTSVKQSGCFFNRRPNRNRLGLRLIEASRPQGAVSRSQALGVPNGTSLRGFAEPNFRGSKWHLAPGAVSRSQTLGVPNGTSLRRGAKLQMAPRSGCRFAEPNFRGSKWHLAPGAVSRSQTLGVPNGTSLRGAKL